MTEIRQPEESDRGRMVEMMRVCFNVPPAWVSAVAPQMRLKRYLGAYEAGRLVAMAGSYDLRHWFGGRPLRAAGVASVAAFPEVRGAGLASEALAALLRRERERGALLASLFPTRAPFYRRLGFEYSGLRTQHRIALADLPPSGAPGGAPGTAWGMPARAAIRAVEVAADTDLESVKTCFRSFAAGSNGLVEGEDEDWWTLRILRRWELEAPTRLVIVRPQMRGGGAGNGAIEGYAAYQLSGTAGSWQYTASCSHMIWLSRAALSALLAYFREFRGLGQALTWWGPPNEPAALLVGGGGESVQPVRCIRSMTRLLDIAGALEARGYPEVDGEAVLSVSDELFPENSGDYRIEAERGRVRVTRGRFPARLSLAIGPLSSLFTGHVSPPELCRLGLIEGDDPSFSFLSRLFAGPPPWMPDIF